ncbi:hypothetical protein H919_11850 [Anoxybacillus flavithermus AK1]|uniref:Uncharacterized protein n=1 Tax=Anoxybacillus flavithermus AK1 TaxID=1297581 RepID=M8DWJ0_9BACL|nr:hypothetical protein H919_11850 [Anoxybacillus flavithermus AK1]
MLEPPKTCSIDEFIIAKKMSKNCYIAIKLCYKYITMVVFCKREDIYVGTEKLNVDELHDKIVENNIEEGEL